MHTHGISWGEPSYDLELALVALELEPEPELEREKNLEGVAELERHWKRVGAEKKKDLVEVQTGLELLVPAVRTKIIVLKRMIVRKRTVA